jgi:hypothetical protein
LLLRSKRFLLPVRTSLLPPSDFATDYLVYSIVPKITSTSPQFLAKTLPIPE